MHLAELRAGFAYGMRREENETRLHQFLARPNVTTLFADEQTTHHYAEVFLQLRQQGTPLPENDLWIAALVRQHKLTLYTRDSHFDCLRQIARI